MNKVKIIHCADAHLGSEISSLGHLGAGRRAEIKNSFLNIIQLCNKEQVRYLLIAGDLFEHVNPNPALVEEIAKAFQTLSNTKVVIAPGNHDYISEDSHYIRKDYYPDNVIIFKAGWEYIEFPEDHLRIFGAGFHSMYEEVPLLCNKKAIVSEDDFIHIGVLHGELVSGISESNYNPITKNQIQESGLDYLALGHSHLRTEIQKLGGTYYSYCGCHEGRGFDEPGEKGIYMGEVWKGGCELRFVPVCKRMHIEAHVDLTGVSNDSQAADIVISTLQSHETVQGNMEENLYKIVLEGMIDDGVMIHREELKAKLDMLYFVKFKDCLEIKTDYALLAKDRSLKGMFVNRMLSKIEELEEKGKKSEALQYREGLHIGLKAFSSEVKYRED